MIKVHITDDHKMLIEGLRSSIDKSGIATVINETYSLAECRNALIKETPDVLLLDLNLPDGNGMDFCQEIKIKYPHIKILILTFHDEFSIIKRVLAYGASGYILKNALSEEVVAGIESVMKGEIFLCEDINILMNKTSVQPVWLTIREQELLRCIVDGYTNREIADKMFLSVETIKTYRKNLIMKLGAKNSMVLVKMAIEKKLI